MKLTKLSTSLLTATIITACSLANANSDTSNSSGNYKIYVFEDCKKVDEIAMTDEQINAYKALEFDEIPMEALEKPLQEMEAKLAIHEQTLENLPDELVVETDDKIVMNKALIKKYTELAEQMEKIVKEHQADIDKIEQQADKISASADYFEKMIKPSIAKYQGDNIQINISDKAPTWRCDA